MLEIVAQGEGVLFMSPIDFITTPGYLDGPGARERAGLPMHTGPHKVITNMAVMGFDEETKRMRIESIHPGYTLEEVRTNVKVFQHTQLPVGTFFMQLVGAINC